MDSTPSTSASSDLTQYAVLLRRRWWVVLACAVMGLAVGGALLVIQPKVYTSSAHILIKDAVSDITQQTGKKSNVNLDTEAAIMKSQQVAVRVKELLKTDEPATELPGRIEVTAIPSSSVLAVSYNSDSPAVAQRGAQHYAQAYLDNRTEQIRASNAKRIGAFRAQFGNLDRQQKTLVEQLVSMPRTQEKLQMQAELRRVQDQMEKFSEKMVELDGAAIDPGQIISDSRAGRQTAPIMPLNLGSGLMIGLLFGIIIALWRERADRRIRRADDIERLLNLPVLLNVPVRGKQPIGLLPARSQGGQAFHELAHSLNATLGHGNHVILVAGVTPGLGAGAICANLAAALARTDDDVVLVCANLPSSYSARLLNLNQGPGLSEILVQGIRVSDVVQAPRELPRMRVITPGNDEDLAWERLQTQSMDRLIQGLRRHATHVIIEAPPTSTSADAQALAEIADASIIVVEIPRAEREHVGEGIRQLDRMGTAVLGAVVLPVQPGAAPPPPVAASRHGQSAVAADSPVSAGGEQHSNGLRPAAGYEDQSSPVPKPPPPPLPLPKPPPPASATRPRRNDGARLAAYPDVPAAYPDAGETIQRGAAHHAGGTNNAGGAESSAGHSSGGARSAAEMFPPETFKTQSFEPADLSSAYEAIDDLVIGPADDEDGARTTADPGRVGDR